MVRPDCPECGEPLAKPFASCRCGWRVKKSNGSPYEHGVKVGDHWVNKTCGWNDRGIGCDRYGHASMGTGGEGPWYCRLHFADLMGWPRIKVVEPEVSMEATDRRVQMLVPKIPGESDEKWSLRCKEWVCSRLKRGVLHREAA